MRVQLICNCFIVLILQARSARNCLLADHLPPAFDLTPTNSTSFPLYICHCINSFLQLSIHSFSQLLILNLSILIGLSELSSLSQITTPIVQSSQDDCCLEEDVKIVEFNF